MPRLLCVDRVVGGRAARRSRNHISKWSTSIASATITERTVAAVELTVDNTARPKQQALASRRCRYYRDYPTVSPGQASITCHNAVIISVSFGDVIAAARVVPGAAARSARKFTLQRRRD